MAVSDELRSPVEERLRRSLEDEGTIGKPLSRRARQTRRTVEAYLNAGDRKSTRLNSSHH